MTIRHQCQCGAKLCLPDNAAGRKARCHVCNLDFVVPAEKDDDDPDGPGAWLAEFAKDESQAAPVEVVPQKPAEIVPPKPAEVAPQKPADVVTPKPAEVDIIPLADDYGDEDNLPALPTPTPSPDPIAASRSHESANDEPAWMNATAQPFWRDLAGSFFFFLDTNSFITFIVIIIVNIAMVPMSFGGIFGTIGISLIAGYLCAFYLSTIVDTASGEDELSNIWISNIFDDLVMPLIRFCGTWMLVLLPAEVFAFIADRNDWGDVTAIVTTLRAIGLFFWPVVILCVAIGGGFRGLWPHTIIRTAFSAPLAYLAICCVLLVAAGITLLPTTDAYESFVTFVLSRSGIGGFALIIAATATLSTYAMILAMRVIGLFYRHYKHKFPWVAE